EVILHSQFFILHSSFFILNSSFFIPELLMSKSKFVGIALMFSGLIFWGLAFAVNQGIILGGSNPRLIFLAFCAVGAFDFLIGLAIFFLKR
ncbi:MAG TPA: hypothetical protein PLL06_14455, partial [Acidobacteriota bacterium]|nr:hypothetical protein [Acidobacteriota bacterium]